MKAIKLEVLTYDTDALGEIAWFRLRDETGQVRILASDIVAEKYFAGQIKFTNLKVKKGEFGGLKVVKLATKTTKKNLDNFEHRLKNIQEKIESLEKKYNKTKDDAIRQHIKDLIADQKDKMIKMKREQILISGGNTTDLYIDINNKAGLARQRKTKIYRQ